MRLNDAKLCLDCDEIFEGDACPKCGQNLAWLWVTRVAGWRDKMCDTIDAALKDRLVHLVTGRRKGGLEVQG